MLQNIRKRNQGFTIIEVLIVLAIAGLIMLIVFLAVPALQRNARNTSRRNDVGRIGAAAHDVLNNNNNNMASVTTANIRTAVGANLAFYVSDPNLTAAAAPAAITNSTTENTVVVYTGGVCADLVGGGRGATSASPATPRSIAVVYSVETGGTAARVCTDS